MNEITLKLSDKMKGLLLICFVLFSLFISESVFAWNALEASRNPVDNCITISCVVYHSKYEKNSVHGRLEYCKLEASVDGTYFYTLMEIAAKWEKGDLPKTTTIILKNKLANAYIEILDNLVKPTRKTTWEQSPILQVKLENDHHIGKFTFRWHAQTHVCFIRATGIWGGSIYPNEHFSEIYETKNHIHSMIKSETSDVNIKASKNDAVNVFKESDAIVIKGADLGENIRVYTTSGVEIKSVISNNDVVKINLPIKQIYNVHIGKSRYKVAV